jgi:hypothetical protein
MFHLSWSPTKWIQPLDSIWVGYLPTLLLVMADSCVLLEMEHHCPGHGTGQNLQELLAQLPSTGGDQNFSRIVLECEAHPAANLSTGGGQDFSMTVHQGGPSCDRSAYDHQ